MSSIPQEAVAPPSFPAILAQRFHWLPGAALASGLAGAALALHSLPGLRMLSPAIMAILLGIAARQAFGLSASLRPGLALATRTLLRVAVVLLGLQVTLGQILDLGAGAVAAVLGGLAICFTATVWLGRRLGVEPKLARLIATGTSVCGASAVVAANSVTRGSDEDVAYAMAAVTVFGTLAMLVMPALAALFGLGAIPAGLWLGASIHEVAQVVGAATQLGEHTTTVATIAKMARILMLAPMVLGMAALARRRPHVGEGPHARVPVPWFVFGFVALAAVASLHVVPVVAVHDSGIAASFMLAAALGAMGFGIDLHAIRRKGARPLILAASAWLIIGTASLGLVALVA